MPYQLTTDQAKLKKLQSRLKEAGDKGLSRDLNKALKAAAKPIVTAEQRAAESLPSKGHGHTGLRQEIAASVSVRVTNSKTNPGVRVYTKRGAAHGLASKTNKPGGWRHPVYGNEKVWVQQVMRPNWWQQASSPQMKKVLPAIRKAIDETIKRIAK